jgi:hypothetical protein
VTEELWRDTIAIAEQHFTSATLSQFFDRVVAASFMRALGMLGYFDKIAHFVQTNSEALGK